MSQNKIVSTIGLLVSLIYGYSTYVMPSEGATFLSGTKVFPIMICIFTAIFSIIILLDDFKKDAEIKKLVVDKKVLKAMLVCSLIFVGYTLIFEILGYIISTTLMLIALLSLINKGKHKINVSIAVIFSVVAYGVFAKLLSISLPAGLIYF